MKTLEELQVGKWYQDSNWYSKQDYAKCKDAELSGGLNKIWFDENIAHGKYDKRRDYWDFNISTLREVPLEEIQEFLHDGHPDKFTTKNTELIELPEKWYFKVTHDNYEKFKDIRSLSRVYGYITNIPFSNLSWGIIYSDPPLGYTEISFEAFEKHVLSKEKSRIISSKPEKTWNPKFKVGDKVCIPVSKQGNLWYKNNISELDDYHKDYFIINGVRCHDNISLIRDDRKVFRENSFCESDLVLYTEPTKEEWVPKIGDWIYANPNIDWYSTQVVKVKEVVTDSDLGFYCKADFKKTFNSTESVVGLNTHWSNKLGEFGVLRKAAFWEIPIEEQTTTISTIDVPNGGLYVSSQRDLYDYFPHIYLGTTKPLTPKESFKTNKLPTKSWY